MLQINNYQAFSCLGKLSDLLLIFLQNILVSDCTFLGNVIFLHFSPRCMNVADSFGFARCMPQLHAPSGFVIEFAENTNGAKFVK